MQYDFCDPVSCGGIHLAGGDMSQKFIQSLFNSMQIESSFDYTNGGGLGYDKDGIL